MTRRCPTAALVALILMGMPLLGVQAGPSGRGRPPWLRVDLRKERASVVPQEVLDPPRERLTALEADGHSYVEALLRTELFINARGQLEERRIHVRRFLTEEGARQAGNIDIWVRSILDVVTVEEAWVALPGGDRRRFDLASLQVVAEPDADVFSDRQRVVFPFAGLGPGATAVLVVRTVRDAPRFPLPWAKHYYPQTIAPVERFEVDVSWAPSQPTPVWKTDDPMLACETPTPRSYSCKRSAIPPVASDPDVASWLDRLPSLVVAAPQSWLDLASRERALMLKGATATPRVSELARQLVGDARTTRERIERLHRYVADRIRYVGFEHGVGAVVPRPADVTLGRRLGDCKDKVALFLALARQAGLDAYPVLVATTRFEVDKLLAPSWQYFDHMIACVRTDGASPICLDLTVPDAATGVLPSSLPGAVALSLDGRADAPGVLSSEPHSWRVHIATRNKMACDGSVAENVVRRYGGPAALALRQFLRSHDAERRKRWLEERFESVMGKLPKPRFELEGVDRYADEVVIRSDASYPGRKPLADTTELAERDYWMLELGSGYKTANRHHPYELFGLELRSVIHYEICPAMVPSFSGAALKLESEFGRLVRKYEVDGSRVSVNTELVLRRQRIPTAKLRRFNKFLENALSQTDVWFGLEKPGGRRR